MKAIESVDSFHLNTVKGWCERGVFLHANDELERSSLILCLTQAGCS